MKFCYENMSKGTKFQDYCIDWITNNYSLNRRTDLNICLMLLWRPNILSLIRYMLENTKENTVLRSTVRNHMMRTISYLLSGNHRQAPVGS